MRLTAKAKRHLGQGARRLAVFCLAAFVLSYLLDKPWWVQVIAGLLTIGSGFIAWKATVLEFTYTRPAAKTTKNGNHRESNRAN